MAEIDLLLGVPALIEGVEQFELLDTPLLTEQIFRAGDYDQLDGDRVVYPKYAFDRSLAGVRGSGSNGHDNSLTEMTLVNHGWIHTSERTVIKPQRLFHRSGRQQLMRSNAAKIIADELGQLLGKHRRTREYFCARLLQDAAGVVVGPSNTDFPANANELTFTMTFDGTFQTFAANAPWNTETTKLFSDTTQQLPQVRSTMNANGHKPGHAIFTPAVAAAIQGNIEAQTFLVNQGVTPEILKQYLMSNASRQGQDSNLTGSIFNGLGAIPKWHLAEHGYTNGAGTFQQYYDDDKFVVLTEDLKNSVALYEGDVFIPNIEQVMQNGFQADKLFSIKKGLVAYAYRQIDDVGSIVLCTRDCFYPAVRNELGHVLVSGVTA
jgi:hypothetical protein